jgi:hypothetical protein
VLVQNVLSISPALGFCFSDCFFGGIISANVLLASELVKICDSSEKLDISTDFRGPSKKLESWEINRMSSIWTLSDTTGSFLVQRYLIWDYKTSRDFRRLRDSSRDFQTRFKSYNPKYNKTKKKVRDSEPKTSKL